jgi:hypothetical protein
VTQRGQQLLVLHADGEQHLVIRIDYATGAPVEKIGIVVPVPAVPTAYGTASAELFDQLDKWVRLRRVIRQPMPRSTGSQSAAPRERAQSVVLLEPARAGPYHIQPIQGRGAGAVRGINEWLVENDMAPIPEAALSYYAERNWTFLAVRVEAEGAPLAKEASLPPLRIRFPSPQAVLPLRLEGQGERVPIRVYHLSAVSLGNDAYQAAHDRRFEVAATPEAAYLGRADPYGQGTLRAEVGRFEREQAPEALRQELGEAGGVFAGQEPLFVRVLHHRGLGSRGENPMAWDEELTIPGLPPGQRVEGVASSADDDSAAPRDEPPVAPAAGAVGEAAQADTPPHAPEEPRSRRGCQSAPQPGISFGWLALALALAFALAWAPRLQVTGRRTRSSAGSRRPRGARPARKSRRGRSTLIPSRRGSRAPRSSGCSSSRSAAR